MSNIIVIPGYVIQSTVKCLQISPKPNEVVEGLRSLQFLMTGAVGDRHSGKIAFSTDREEYVPHGTPLNNDRPITITDQLECEMAADDLGIQDILPVDLMCNIHLAGVSTLSTLPSGTIIKFFQNKYDGVERALILKLTGRNGPCGILRKRIENRLQIKIDNQKFKEVLRYKRGCKARVEKLGEIWLGDRAEIIIPEIAIEESLLFLSGSYNPTKSS